VKGGLGEIAILDPDVVAGEEYVAEGAQDLARGGEDDRAEDR
jgi:hypothetical protein